jgi:endonuclease/exonuclease/phosphatase (EEP) superfamily protein YafD
VATLELGSEPVTIVATHPVPPFGSKYWRLRNEQYDAIAAARDEFGERLIVAGDFNASRFSPCLKHFVAAMHRPDARLRYASRGRGFNPTWPTFNRLMFTPIDQIFVTEHLAVVEYRTGPHIGSDHLPVRATIALGR